MEDVPANLAAGASTNMVKPVEAKETPESTNKVKLVVEAKEKEIPQDQIRQNFAVMVEVVGPELEARAPVDLVMLLDISASMAWKSSQPGWTRLALMKAAAQLIINKLGPHDRLAIVPFNGRVVRPTGLVYMTHEGHTGAVGKVLGLRTGPDTKFFPALEHAAQLLQNREAGDKTSPPGFVFLISDGEDTTVLNKPLNDCYPVHTVSICEKCNPQSLHYVSAKTRGTFHVVKDKLSELAHAVGVFLGGLTSVVAVDTRIDLNTVDDCVLIKDIKAGNLEKHVKDRDTWGQIVVGILCAKEVKRFIVCLKVPKANTNVTNLLKVAGSYFTPVDRKRHTIAPITVIVKRTGENCKPSPTPTVSTIILVETVRVEVFSIVETLVTKYNDNTDNEPNHQSISKELKENWQVCKNKLVEDVLKHPLVVALGEEMDMLVEHAEQGSGQFYMLSWLTAHATQQATTWISPKPTTKPAVFSCFQTQLTQQVATEAVYHMSGYSKPPDGESDPCKCVDFNKISPKPTTKVDATSSSSLVEVTTIPKATAITHGDSCNNFEVVVRVTAAGLEKMKSRMPIDLVAVLDVSGSMGWPASREVKEERLELLKKAMYFIIKKLSPQDSLAIVAFNGDVDEVHTTGLFPIPRDDRGSVNDKVKNLVARGGTAFLPALNRAVKILEGRSAESKKERLGFIFLLTDGEDTTFHRNEHIDDRYPVHTFGLCGAADPRAMLYIAEKSHGTYSSVSDKITEAFARCLGGLQSVVAFDTHIQLTCKAGVKINRIESGNYDKGIDKNETCGWIKVGQLYAGEEKNFIVYLNVPKAAADSNSSILLAADGKCKRAPGQKDDDIGGHDFSVDRPKEAVVAVAASPVVVQQIVRLRLIHFFEKFRKKYEGMRSFDMFMQYADLQIPTNIKEQQKNAGEWLRKEWNKFKDDSKNWSDDEKNVLLNGGFDKDVDVMVDNLTKGLGQTYVLSWLSTYLMERAADSDTFQTPSMKHLVEEAKDPEKVEPTESTVVPAPALSALSAAAGAAVGGHCSS